MGYTTCGIHNRKCCWRCDACPKCDGVTLLRGSYCVECTAKFKAEGAVWVRDYQNYISAEDYEQIKERLAPPAPKQNALCSHDEIKSRCILCADRACADCDQYAKGGAMTQQRDGRLICQACQRAIENAARNKAQSNLFVHQTSLF